MRPMHVDSTRIRRQITATMHSHQFQVRKTRQEIMRIPPDDANYFAGVQSRE